MEAGTDLGNQILSSVSLCFLRPGKWGKYSGVTTYCNMTHRGKNSLHSTQLHTGIETRFQRSRWDPRSWVLSPRIANAIHITPKWGGRDMRQIISTSCLVSRPGVSSRTQMSSKATGGYFRICEPHLTRICTLMPVVSNSDGPCLHYPPKVMPHLPVVPSGTAGGVAYRANL